MIELSPPDPTTKSGVVVGLCSFLLGIVILSMTRGWCQGCQAPSRAVQ